MGKVKIYQFEFFQYPQKSFTCVAEALTPLLRLDTYSWIVAYDSHQKNSQFPALVAAHQADVLGRGPQVENRWYRVSNRNMAFFKFLSPCHFWWSFYANMKKRPVAGVNS